MARPLIDTVSALERLAAEVRDLERRVRTLEERALEERALEARALQARTAATNSRAAEPAPFLQPAVKAPDWFSSGSIPVLGTAILGIGGAYLLRAIAESETLPRPAAVAVGVCYAALWLLLSIRQSPGREQAGVVYAATASLILLPMLWEATVRFKVLEPRLAATLLITFVVAGDLLAWTRDRSALMWVTAVPAAIAAVALIVTTGELAAFTIALLAMAAMVEAAAIRDRWVSLRPAVAFFANTGIWLTIYVSALPHAPGSYQPATRTTAIVLAFALLAIYAASMGCRNILLRKKVTLFEAGQTAVACILAVGGTLRFVEQHAALGAFCLLASAACYFAAFKRCDMDGSGSRNHAVFGNFGLALLLAASALLLHGPWAALLWSALAVAGMFVAGRISSQRFSGTLAMHASICLMAAALVSGLFEYGWLAMTATALPGLSSFPWVEAVAAAFCYAACSAGRTGEWPRLVAASLTVYAVLASLVTMLVPHDASSLATASWLATARTLVLCAEALVAAGVGARWRRRELVWISYAAIALVTLKLFVEDFHQDSPAALAVALLSYGTLLVLVPRLTRNVTAEIHPNMEDRS